MKKNKLLHLGLLVVLAAPPAVLFFSKSDNSALFSDGKKISIESKKSEGSIGGVTFNSLENKTANKLGDRKFTFVKRVTTGATPFEELYYAAKNGNVAAALKVFKLLKMCGGIVKDPEAFTKMKESILTSKMHNDSVVENPQELVTTLEAKHKRCGDVPDLPQISAYKMLLIAADAGLPEAQVESILFPPDIEYEEGTKEYLEAEKSVRLQVVKYLELAAQQGSADAYFWLGNALHAGVMTERDDTKSLAYLTVASLAFSSNDQGRAMDELKRQVSDGLSPDSIRLAEVLAQDLLEKNGCCFILLDEI